jgi:16S rRNA (guanine527-N7)-methyltransferase
MLEAGLHALGFALEADRRAALLSFLELLDKWNRVYNLTAVRDPREMVTTHLLDSLTILPYLHGRRLIDVGTGAGLPGMALALAKPEGAWTLLDSNAKKVRFLTQVVIELKPGNVEVVRARAEEYRPLRLFDTVVARAVCSLKELLGLTRHLIAPEGRLLAMKGTYPEAELDALGSSCPVPQVYRLNVPGLEAERHLVVFDFAEEPPRV